mmetsp:Transcript_17723/g.52875  ORF Transcript_17723/g.52875 Transcript_17723/m.52875 type:complete len:234 (-) Transcript_17723:211-912(-)
MRRLLPHFVAGPGRSNAHGAGLRAFGVARVGHAYQRCAGLDPGHAVRRFRCGAQGAAGVGHRRAGHPGLEGLQGSLRPRRLDVLPPPILGGRWRHGGAGPLARNAGGHHVAGSSQRAVVGRGPEQAFLCRRNVLQHDVLPRVVVREHIPPCRVGWCPVGGDAPGRASSFRQGRPRIAARCEQLVAPFGLRTWRRGCCARATFGAVGVHLPRHRGCRWAASRHKPAGRQRADQR